MSYDKLTKAENRFQDYRVTEKQKGIYLLYNDHKWLTERRVGGFRKSKSMNCSCDTCRRWGKEEKRYRLVLQLRKAGMFKSKEELV